MNFCSCMVASILFGICCWHIALHSFSLYTKGRKKCTKYKWIRTTANAHKEFCRFVAGTICGNFICRESIIIEMRFAKEVTEF